MNDIQFRTWGYVLSIHGYFVKWYLLLEKLR